METPVEIPTFSSEYYAKSKFRAAQAGLSYPEKVRQIVAMQRRFAPIYARRDITIVPWKLD